MDLTPPGNLVATTDGVSVVVDCKAMRHFALAGLAVILLIIPTAGAAGSPPAPTNLEVVAATETSITLAWGPSMVANFQGYDAAKRNQLIVGWDVSEDTRGAVTYTVTKNGSLLTSTLTTNEILITGLGAKVKQFRICVTPFAAGKAGPVNCSTFDRI